MSGGFDTALFRYVQSRAREVPAREGTLYAAAQCVLCSIIAKAAIDEGEARGIADALRSREAREALDVVISLVKPGIAQGIWQWSALAANTVDSQTDLRPGMAAKAFARFCAERAVGPEPIDAFAAFDGASRSWAASAQFLGASGASVFGGDAYEVYVRVCVGLMSAASAGDRAALLEILSAVPARDLVRTLGRDGES